jgi:hypothetical protein
VTCIETVQVTTTFTQALENIGQLAQPIIVASEQPRTSPAPA